MWIRPLAAADASCGAKAHGLARLIAAGLRVPDGFVIEHAAFAEVAALAEVGPDAIGHALGEAARRIAEAALPAALEAEVRAGAAALGRVAVRSSASLEDGALGAAAGVFASVTDVAPGEVWAAIRAVWTSALTPLAVAYARRRAAAIAIAVIVQRFVPGERATVYTRPIGAPAGAALWLQRGDRLAHVPRAGGPAIVDDAAEAAIADRAADAADAEVALAAEAAIAAPAGADVELVHAPGDPRPWIVQARPIVHPARRTRRSPPPIVIAPLVADGRRWAWDVAHNPDPLSPAQAGLVEHVERAGAAPYASRVCGGYLYTAAGDPRPAPAPPADAAELRARIAAIEARFMLDPAASVAAAVERYVAFVRIWAFELSPLVGVARRQLLDRLARDGHPPGELAAIAARLIGPRRAPRDRVMAPAWDVAVPTFAERAAAPTTAPDGAGRAAPDLLSAVAASPMATAALASDLDVPPAPSPPERAAEIALARAAADAAEHDDLWFARAQWLVRSALLAHGRALGWHGDDVFWLPLDDLIADRACEPDDAHRRASAARAAHARAADWDMPMVVHGQAPLPPSAAEPSGLTSLRGVGVGPRVVGPVVRFSSLAAAAPVRRGAIVVTRAITPALAMLVEGCAALISETGGLLDHGAALARELGIPCVVGCAHAWTRLVDGTLVAVDGDAGTVTILPGAAE